MDSQALFVFKAFKVNLEIIFKINALYNVLEFQNPHGPSILVLAESWLASLTSGLSMLDLYNGFYHQRSLTENTWGRKILGDGKNIFFKQIFLVSHHATL